MELRVAGQAFDQRVDSLGVTLGPVGLRKQVVDDVEPARLHNGESFIEPVEFAAQRIGEDEIEAGRRLAAKIIQCILKDKSQALV